MLLVTRPQPQADEWVQALQHAGLHAVAVPLLQVAPPPDTAAVAGAWLRLSGYDGAMFVSPAAVNAWMEARPANTPWPSGVWAAAPGPGTARALVAQGVSDVLAPAHDAQQFDSEALWDAIRHRPWQGKRVLIVHGGGGRERLATLWRDAGATVDAVQAYTRGPAPLGGERMAWVQHALRAPGECLWLFSSGEAAKVLPAVLPQAPWQQQRALCTHPAIGEVVRRMGWADVTVVSPVMATIVEAAKRRL